MRIVELYKQFVGGAKAVLDARFNLFSPDYKTEIRVFQTVDGDLQVFAPNPKDIQQVKDMCSLLVQSAHILGLKHGLKLQIGGEA